MARLPRKKTSSGKKKKRIGAVAGAPDEATRNSLGAKSAPAVATARDVRKKQPFVPKRAAAGRRADPGKIRGTIEKSMQFLREVKVELKKVTWPSRKQTMGSTVVVLVLVMIISFFLGMADIGLSSLIRVVLH